MAHKIIVTEKDLEFVSQKAGDNWRSLLTNLGLGLTKIEEFLLKHTGDTRNACFKGLVHWLHGNASEADEPVSFASLCSALRKSSMNDCASDLEKKRALSLQSSHIPPAEDHQEVVTGPVVSGPPSSPPTTQGQPTSTVSTEDGRSEKIEEIVAIYRNNEKVHLPCIPELVEDFEDIMVTMDDKLSSADLKTVRRICGKLRLKHRHYIHGVRTAPLPVIPETPRGLYDFIAEKSTPYEVLLVHHTVEYLQCEDLKADLKEYEERLTKHLESTLLSWKKKNVILPSRKDHTHLAIVLRSRPDVVLLALVLHIKEYLVTMLQLEEALFEGFTEDCTILFFSILTTDAVLLSPKVISHLPELKRKFEITHLVVFGYFACDLELGSVEIFSQSDDFEMKLKESMENSELLRHELMEVKEKSEQQEHELMEVKSQRDDFELKLKESLENSQLLRHELMEVKKSEQLLQKSELTERELKEVKIKSERLHNELIAAKMELKLKNELERDTFGNSIIQLEEVESQLSKAMNPTSQLERLKLKESKSTKKLKIKELGATYSSLWLKVPQESKSTKKLKIKELGTCKETLHFPQSHGDLWGIAVSPTGNIFVSDYSKHQIHVLNTQQQYIRTFSEEGTGKGQLKYPRGLAVDSNRLVYVANDGHGRVEVFEEDGSFVRQIGVGQLECPRNIAIYGDRLFIPDFANDRVFIFNTSGELKQTIGGPGEGLGQLKGPTAIAVYNNELFITDYFNNRVQVFSVNGQYNRELLKNQVKWPRDILITHDGEVLIADSLNNSVAIFNTSGDILNSLDVLYPNGLAINTNSELLVTGIDGVCVFT